MDRTPENQKQLPGAGGGVERTKQDASPLHRLPSLDGWRAASILLVLGCHCHYVAGHPPLCDSFWYLFFFDGGLGVRCFFLISGLLITWLMLVEHDTAGGVNLRHFYIRRALRILPVYFTYLGVLFCLHLLTPFNQSRGAWISNLTFTTNFVEGSWPSGHLWSLSVEEQFYLLWPALFVACGMASKTRVAFRVLALPMLVAPAWRLMTYKQFYPRQLGPAFAHFSFFNYFDCLAVGCVCAFLLRHHRARLEKWLGGLPMVTAATGILLVFFPKLLFLVPLPGRIVMAFSFTFQSLGMALLVTQSIIMPQRGFYPVLNWKWVRHLGVLSYSIYIWQQLFCSNPALFGLTAVWWISFPGWFVPVLAVAHLSYFALERPLFRLRSRFR
jgi:peptidoglycan/LPS O-acetylase OafA/YrhL